MSENSIDAEARIFGKTPIVIRYPAGPRGPMFKPDAVGSLANRANFNTRDEGFAYLADDIAPPLLYFRRTTSVGVWSNGIPYGVAGEGDKYYEWTQNNTSARWGPIPHMLGKYPAHGVKDSAGNGVLAGIEFIDLDHCYLTFAIPTSGIGYFS